MENSNSKSQYVLSSKQFIDKLIVDCEYKKAFNMLITVLGKLDEINKQEFIHHYDKLI